MNHPVSQRDNPLRIPTGLTVVLLVFVLGAIVVSAGRSAPTPAEAPALDAMSFVATFEATAMSPDGHVGYLYWVNGVARYVGKGMNGRDRRHLEIAKGINAKRAASESVRANRWWNFLAKALREGCTIEVVRVAEDLTHEQACTKEIELIALHGRVGVDGGGTLCNELAGGDGTTSEDQKRIKNLPEVRKKMSVAMKKAWADPEARARMLAIQNRPDVKDRRVAALRAAMNHPEVRRKMSAAQNRPEVIEAHRVAWSQKLRKQISAEKRAAWADPELRKRMSAGMKAAWADPELRKRVSGGQSPVARAYDVRLPDGTFKRFDTGTEGAKFLGTGTTTFSGAARGLRNRKYLDVIYPADTAHLFD